MLERLGREIDILKRNCPSLEVNSEAGCVVLRAFSLPPGWNTSTIDILVIIPPGYPVTPPDNFFVPVGLRLQDGQMPSNYSEATHLLDADWGQFSFHSQEWRPAPGEADGDNLLTFVALVNQRLAEVN